MLFLTHLLGGIVSVAYFGSFFSFDSGISVKIAGIAVAALFSILPDIDMVKSKAGKNLQPFSTLAAFFFKHRGFLHSFVFAALVYFGARYLLSPAMTAAATIGYASHLLLDSLTKEGIRPLSPLSKMKIRGFVKTGGIIEKFLAATMFVLLLLRLI